MNIPMLIYRPIQIEPFPMGQVLLCERGRERLIYSGSIDFQTCAKWVDAARAPSFIPEFLKTEGALIPKLKRCYDELDPDRDYQAFEQLYAFRVAHDLAMYNRGVEMPMIILVQNELKVTVLSFDGEDCQISLSKWTIGV